MDRPRPGPGRRLSGPLALLPVRGAHAARRLRPARLEGAGRAGRAPVARPRRLAEPLPAARDFDARRGKRRGARLPVRARGGRRRARDPGGSDPRRHHRARPLPLLGRGREGAAPRGAPGLHAQGHRQALPRARAAEAHRLAGRVSGDSTVAYAWAYCMALEAAAGAVVPPRARLAARAAARARARRQPPRRPRRARQRRRARLRPGAVLAAARDCGCGARASASATG